MVLQTRRGETIAETAYGLWRDDGCPDGRADEYWRRAQVAHDAGVLALDPCVAAGRSGDRLASIASEQVPDRAAGHEPAAEATIPALEGKAVLADAPHRTVQPTSGGEAVADRSATRDRPTSDDPSRLEGALDWRALTGGQMRRGLATLHAFADRRDLETLASQQGRLLSDSVTFVLQTHQMMMEATRLAYATATDLRTAWTRRP